MFGFGSGRIGPQDHTLSHLEEMDRRGRVIGLPSAKPTHLSQEYVDQLKSLPRTEVVTVAEVRAMRESVPSLEIAAGKLLLPAERFLLEVDHVVDGVPQPCIVDARRRRVGEETYLLLIVLTQALCMDVWTATVPVVMTTLTPRPPGHVVARFATDTGQAALCTEIFTAVFAVAVVDARQREMLGAEGT